MTVIKQLSTAGKHNHLCLILDDGSGISSKDAKHQHEIQYVPEQPAIDPNTGQPVIDPNTGQPQMQKAGYVVSQVNNHTHEIQSLILDEKDREKPDNQKSESGILSNAVEIYNAVQTNERNYQSMASKCEKMYFGDQWDTDIKNQLRSEERPCLNINKIEAVIKALIGYEYQNGNNFKYSPVEGGDQVIADILNALNIHNDSLNNFRHVRSEVFEDQSVTGRGNFNLYVDITQNLEGDVVIERFPYDSIGYLEHEKLDASDCESICAWRWVTGGALKLMMPDKIKEIESGKLWAGSSITGKFKEFYDIKKKRIKLVMIQMKEYKERKILINPILDFYLDGQEGRISSQDLSKKQINQILSIDGFSEITRMTYRIREIKFAGDQLLRDEYSRFSDFTIIPVYATKRKDLIKGKVSDLIDSQEELNKRRSTMSEIASKMAANPTYYDPETFDDELEQQMFLDNRSRPGYAGRVGNINNRPQTEPTVPLPDSLVKLEQAAQNDIFTISGVNQEMLGMMSNATSTPLYSERRNAALIGNEFLFSHMSLSLKKLGRLKVEAFKLVYTPERVYKILENRNKAGAGLKLNDIPFEQYDQREVMRLWEQSDLTRYDILVTDGADSPSKRNQDFMLWVEIKKQDPTFPTQFLVELSDLPPQQKEKFNQMISAQQQQQMQLEQAKMQTELDKTAMAQQGKQQQNVMPA